jgi:hypothetical protein
MKVFRDLIYVMRGLMQDDLGFRRKHGFSDSRQKQSRARLEMQLAELLLRSWRTQKWASQVMAPAK